MAENFPYFKFIATEWLTGNIALEPLNIQGLFINVCALYWQRDGMLTISDLKKRYKNIAEIELLIGEYIIVNNDKISIQFLDEQLIHANHISLIRKEVGSIGGKNKAIGKQLVSKGIAKHSKEEEKKNKNKSKEEINIPTLSEFLDYLKTKVGNDYINIENTAKLKYEAWVENGWRDGYDKKITNWKSKLLNTIPHLKSNGKANQRAIIGNHTDFGKF